MVLSIPPFSWICDLLMSENFINSYELIMTILSLVIYFFYPLPAKVPYGITTLLKVQSSNRKTALHLFLAKTINNRLAIFLMHFPALFIFSYIQLYFLNGNITSIPSIIFVVMYIYRCFIYPFFRKKHSFPISYKAILIIGLISFNNGLVISRHLVFNARQDMITEIILTFIIFLSFILLVVHDWIVCSSRPDPKEKVPFVPINKFFFLYLSCPQYGLQLFIWIVYSFFVPNFKTIVSFLPWLFTILMRRADLIHSFYLITGAQRRNQKTPCFPILEHAPNLPLRM